MVSTTMRSSMCLCFRQGRPKNCSHKAFVAMSRSLAGVRTVFKPAHLQLHRVSLPSKCCYARTQQISRGVNRPRRIHQAVRGVSLSPDHSRKMHTSVRLWRPEVLRDSERRTALASLPHWQMAKEKDGIARELKFENFVDAMAFMVKVGFKAEEMAHHPEWSNVYNTVSIVLTTHDAGDAGGLSSKDIALAKFIDQTYSTSSSSQPPPADSAAAATADQAPATEQATVDGVEYTPPKVWSENKDMGGNFASINRPTAGAREQVKLPVGKHKLQLYSLGTPNGQKVAIMLEELNDAVGLEYDAWKINIGTGEQFGSDFVAINPNSKIPALKDLDGPGGKPINVFESASICLYLAEKTGKFIPKDPALKVECMNWVFWTQGSAPYLGGGFGHFYKYAPKRWRYPIDRFTMEAKRILSVLDNHLKDGRKFICGDEVTIADFVTMPWFRFPQFYDAEEFIEFKSYKHVNAYIERMLSRPAVQRGMRVNGFSDNAIAERHSRADFDRPPEEPKKE